MTPYRNRLPQWQDRAPDTFAGRPITPDLRMRALANGDEPGMTRHHDAERLVSAAQQYARGLLTTGELLDVSFGVLAPAAHRESDKIITAQERVNAAIDVYSKKRYLQSEEINNTVTASLLLRYAEIEKQAHERLYRIQEKYAALCGSIAA